MASIVGYALSTLDSYRVKRKVTFIVLAGYMFLPIYGLMGISLWKDVAHSIALFWLTIIVAKIYMTNGEWVSNKKNVVILTVCLLFVALFRHEGIVSALGTLIAMYAFFSKGRRYIRFIFICWLVMIVSVKLVFSILLHVGPPMQYGFIVPQVQHIAEAMHQGWAISEDEQKVLGKVMPMQVWKEKYDPYRIAFIFDKEANLGALIENKHEIYQIWTRLLRTNPEIIVKEQAEFSSLIWRIKECKGTRAYYVPFEFEPTQEGPYKVRPRLMDNQFGFTMSNIVPSLQKELFKVFMETTKTNITGSCGVLHSYCMQLCYSSFHSALRVVIRR